MTTQVLSIAQGNLKIALWQVDADAMSSSDLYIWLNDCGLPHEVTIRLHELTTYTKKVGSKVFAIGKIILIKIIEFVKAHPNLSVGIALGAAVGLLASSVPFIGPVLGPVAAALGITLGAIAGNRLDQGYRQVNGLVGITQDIIQITQLFFKLLIDVFNVVFCNVITA